MRFKQSEDVIHLAVEFLDRLFLSIHKQIIWLRKYVVLFHLTVVLSASKYDEMDENIPLISDLIKYYKRMLPEGDPIPTYNQVIEAERAFLEIFDWDLMIVIPTYFIKSLLSNGIVFENEAKASLDYVQKVSDETILMLNILVKEYPHFRDKKASLLAAAVIYAARKK